MNYEQVIQYLYKIGEFNTNLGLANVSRLLSKLGNPHKDLKVIHVAGTNGKGSVCAMLTSILSSAGYKVGMYTSPHLVDFRERFLVNGKKISKSDVARLGTIVKKHHTTQTFFEFITAMAFLYFKEQKVDYLVLEVGLGGRLDATNVIIPLLSIITNVTFDHKEYLGSKIANIAYEKAGIIKNGVSVVTAAKGVALNVIKHIAKDKKSDIFIVSNSIKRFKLGLEGSFQQINASIALKAINILRQNGDIDIKDSDIVSGLKKVSWPGRFEHISPNVLVDCAHNPDGVRVLVNELKSIKKKIIFIVDIMKDKDKEAMIRMLDCVASRFILTKVHLSRAEEPEVLSSMVSKPYEIIKDPRKALSYAKSICGKDDLIVVAGSIYLVGEIYS